MKPKKTNQSAESDSASVGSFIRTARALLPELPRALIPLFIAILFYEVIKLIPVYFVKLVIDNIFTHPDTPTLVALILAILALYGVLVWIEIRSMTRVARTAVRLQRSVLERCFEKLTDLPMSWHERANTGSTVTKVTKASNYVNQLVWFLNNDILPTLVQIVLTAAVLLWIDWRVGIIYVLFTPLLLVLIDRQFRGAQPFRRRYHIEHEEATRELAQTLQNIQTVKDYTQEEREAQTHRARLIDYMTYHDQRTDYEERSIILRDVLTTFVRVGTIGVAVALVLKGSLTPGDLVFVITLTEKAYLNLYRLGRVYNFMGDTHESLERALTIQQTPNTLPDGTQDAHGGELRFENVDFTYGREPVLHKVSVRFPIGSTTAIVGPSGSGKTTLVKLLARHYDPTRGRVTLAGADLRTLKLKSVRRRIAFVSQHTEVFDRTVAENIAYARPDASRAEIISAAKKANAHGFITDFIDGYDTVVGERGVRLSGGQRQRLSIARAILANPDIIIFDEATSSLDSESERAIQEAVFKIRGKTLIIIAHRLSTIEHADHIVVLDKGRVIEEGARADLIKRKGGIYRRMRSLQNLGELRR